MKRSASGSTDFPLSSERDRAWIADEAEGRVRKWSSSDGSGTKDTIDWTKYASAHFWRDDANKTNFTGYKLPFADIVDGKPTAIWHGVTAAAAVMQGSRGGASIPDADVAGVKRKIEAYYAKARAEFNDDTIQVPWAGRSETIKLSRQFRYATMQRASAMPAGCAPTMDPSQSPMYELSFSDETPVDRFFGKEILLHGPGNVRLDRINGGAPFLFNHDMNDPRGVVVPGSVKVGPDRKGRAMVQFLPTPEGQQARAMVDAGLRNTSVGYDIYAVRELPNGDGFEATDWSPLEISLAPVPAVTAVGFSRAAPGTEHDVQVQRSATAVRDAESRQPAANAARRGVAMSDAMTAAAAGNAESTSSVSMGVDNGAQERLRIKTLQALGRQHSVPAEVVEQWVDDGVSGDDAAHKCLQIIAERQKRNVKDASGMLGLSESEIKRYSVARAIRAAAEKSWAKGAGFEAEASQAIARKIGRQASSEFSFFVPMEVQLAAPMGGQRDLLVGTNTLGGYLVGTTVQGFIDLLRNRSVVMRMGATMLPGLSSTVSIPKLTAGATAYWFASEAGTATESTPTIGQLTLSPKTVGGYTEISRQLLLQTAYGVDAIVNGDLAKCIALAVDTAALAGPGTAGQPTGIASASGVGTANPATGTAVVYSDLLSFQSTVASSNALMPGFGYVSTPTVAKILMGKAKFTNTGVPIWEGAMLDGQIAGCPAMSSLQIGSGSMIGGDFSSLVIGEWGVLEIEANPYAQFQSGIIGVRALYTVDVGIRYAAAFALGTGITG